MYTRKQIRYSIKRCRAEGEHPQNHQEVFNYVMEKLPEDLDIHKFPKEWDVIVSRKGELVFVEPERDLDYIQATCTEAKILSKRQIDFTDELNDRQLNIINIVENLMLDNKMTWENYGDAWKVTLDLATSKMDTRLLNVKPGQVVVTQQMLDEMKAKSAEMLSEEARLRAEDKAAGISYDQTIDLTGSSQWQELTPEEQKALEEMRKRK